MLDVTPLPRYKRRPVSQSVSHQELKSAVWVKNATMVFFPGAGSQALSRSISSPLDARFTVTPRSNCRNGWVQQC